MPTPTIETKTTYKYDILYVASDNHHNITAFKWFLSKVYPMLEDIKILCVGKIYNKIDNHAEYKNIEFIEFVDDLTEAYNNSKIVICPMFTGTGVKIKIVEAMSYGKPIVANEMGMIGFPTNKDTGCLVTNNPDDFAKHMQNLLVDNQLFENCSKQATTYFDKYFSYDKNVQKLDRIFGAVNA